MQFYAQLLLCALVLVFALTEILLVQHIFDCSFHFFLETIQFLEVTELVLAGYGFISRLTKYIF